MLITSFLFRSMHRGLALLLLAGGALAAAAPPLSFPRVYQAAVAVQWAPGAGTAANISASAPLSAVSRHLKKKEVEKKDGSTRR